MLGEDHKKAQPEPFIMQLLASEKFDRAMVYVKSELTKGPRAPMNTAQFTRLVDGHLGMLGIGSGEDNLRTLGKLAALAIEQIEQYRG